MASHSGRPGAIRKKGTKKGAQVGTGGHSRRRLEGKGPTPKAEDRTYHPAHKRKVKREAREAQEAAIARARAKSSIRVKPGHELIAGRNPVAEAARASVPIERVFVLDNVKDDRVEEVVRLAAPWVRPSTRSPAAIWTSRLTVPFTRASPSRCAATSTPTPRI